MAESNRKLNQSVDLNSFVVKPNSTPAKASIAEDSYLATEGDIDPFDHREQNGVVHL